MNIRLTSLFVSLFLSVPVWAGGHKNLPAKGDLHIPVFENVNVRFSPDTYPDNYNEADGTGVYHLVNGRIILKKDYSSRIQTKCVGKPESNPRLQWRSLGQIGFLLCIA